MRNVLVLILILALANAPQLGFAQQRYVSPDRRLTAVVVKVGKKKSESRVEIHATGGKLLSHADYGSPDGEHGQGVERAAWTPDSQFFVWSMESSGGHSLWHHSTYFYSRRWKRVLSLDDFVGAITAPDFKLKAPDIVQTKRIAGQNIEGVPVNVKLSNLLKSKK